MTEGASEIKPCALQGCERNPLLMLPFQREIDVTKKSTLDVLKDARGALQQAPNKYQPKRYCAGGGTRVLDRKCRDRARRRIRAPE